MLVVVIAAVATACQAGMLTASIGTGTAGNTGDGKLGTVAQMVTPESIAPIPGGGYYVLDIGVCVIRKLAPNAVMSTVAGTGTCGFSGDGGPAHQAQFGAPGGGASMAGNGLLALDGSGNLYLADTANNRIRRISTDGTITTVSVSGAGACGQVGGVAIGATGSVLVNCGTAVDELQADQSFRPVITYPAGTIVLSLKTGADGNLYDSIYNSSTYSSTVQRLNVATGTTTTVVPAISSKIIVDVAVASDGTIYGTDLTNLLGGYTDRVYRLSEDGGVTIAGNQHPDPGTGVLSGLGTAAPISPAGIAIAPNGSLLISSGHVVYSLNAPASAGSGAPSTSIIN